MFIDSMGDLLPSEDHEEMPAPAIPRIDIAAMRAMMLRFTVASLVAALWSSARQVADALTTNKT